MAGSFALTGCAHRGTNPADPFESWNRKIYKFNQAFDSLNRREQIEKITNIMGINNFSDPDPSYQLTEDNVNKLLAIHMRIRTNMPIIIMGETGCGKTRMVKFLCDLQIPSNSNLKNMFIVKVHGGTTELDIEKVVMKADQRARSLNKEYKGDIILFLDEMNSTEAIGYVKQVVCDRRVGQHQLDERLKIICACNPYRKHSDTVIMKLERAGLGYRVRAEATADRFGHVPMRQLVYRVQPLPLSLIPFCWDFGQLSPEVETLYIKQLVARALQCCNISELWQPLTPQQQSLPIQPKRTPTVPPLQPRQRTPRRQQTSPATQNPTPSGTTPGSTQVIQQPTVPAVDPATVSAVAGVLSKAQQFMRERLRDECSFVSLRDVERALSILLWFLEHRDPLFTLMEDKERSNKAKKEENKAATAEQQDNQAVTGDEQKQHSQHAISNLCRALILSLAVCYHSSLQNMREDFRKTIAPEFQCQPILRIPNEDPANRMINEIELCENVFLDQCTLPEHIARNESLRENVFLMSICSDRRIPLFLVGKPGSSKSLAKLIVQEAMQGDQSRSPIFRQMKRIAMISFQCSPLATADSIINTFRQAARYQKKQDLTRYVGVVVLDEIGLAEDSPHMPLKALHALLETGIEGFEEEADVVDENTVTAGSNESQASDLFAWSAALHDKLHEYKRVGFIGISNWALDPAKTNRGILGN